MRANKITCGVTWGKECGLVERAQVVKPDSPGVANDQLGHLTEFLITRIKNSVCERPGQCMSLEGRRRGFEF